MEQGGVKPVFDAQILSPGDASFDSLELKAGQIREAECQAEKQGEWFEHREIGLIGRLIGEIDQQDQNEINKIAKHIDLVEWLIRWNAKQEKAGRGISNSECWNIGIME